MATADIIIIVNIGWIRFVLFSYSLVAFGFSFGNLLLLHNLMNPCNYVLLKKLFPVFMVLVLFLINRGEED